jgi:hypothetical protein
MTHRNLWTVLAAVLTLGTTVAQAQSPDPAATDKWQSVAKTDNQEAFVNVASIKLVAGMPEARVKQNFTQAQPSAKKGKSYLSARSTYRFDCAQRRVGMKELRAYPGLDLQGEVVQKATAADKNMQWNDATERTVFGELLDFVCGKAPAG